MSYANDLRPGSCTEPVRGENMIQGAGGGYGFDIDDWKRLDRFLILGHEGGTFYANQRDLTIGAVDCIDRLLESNSMRLVNHIADLSLSGRAPKNDPAIFAMAYIVSKNTWTSATVYSRLNDVCRTGTHLFQFIEFCKQMGKGWGSGFKRAVANWYNRNPRSLANQVTKYKQRGGWSHRDVLRKCHARHNSEVNNILEYVAQKDAWMRKARIFDEGNSFLCAVEEVANPLVGDHRRVQLIHQHNLLREHMPTSSLNNPAIWEALLNRMPLTAMIRNLNKMSNVGLLTPMSEAEQMIVARLNDAEALKDQRVHPVTLLKAYKTYKRGFGLRGNLAWTVNRNVLDALNDSFYLSFDTVEPTNKRFLLGVDVSGSMNHPVNGADGLISCREAAAVMAMVAARTEPVSYIMGFGHQFYDLRIGRRDTLETALEKCHNRQFHATRCALPVEWAMEHNVEVDMFCIYTDNETNRGPHPYDALKRYRDNTGIPAKMAVFGLAHSNFSIAKPNDAGMMDFVGFDTAAPSLLADFAVQ